MTFESERVRLVNAMTVDVEDYFHVTAFASVLDPGRWDTLEYRVERNTHRVLELFARYGVSATFFVLGWVTKRSPGLIREILAAGHEIACHGMTHELVYRQSPAVFREQTTEAKSRLEQVAGVRVRGYRAASYSITSASLWALDILNELGFEYDSSIFPVRHDVYGIRDAPRRPFQTGRGRLYEIPLTTVDVWGMRVPCGGGGYFRILPYCLFSWALRRVNFFDGMPAVFYFHPWEIDPAQPRIARASLRSRLRHYTNLGQMESRLQRLLKDFSWDRMSAISLGAPPEIGDRASVPERLPFHIRGRSCSASSPPLETETSEAPFCPRLVDSDWPGSAEYTSAGCPSQRAP